MILMMSVREAGELTREIRGENRVGYTGLRSLPIRYVRKVDMEQRDGRHPCDQPDRNP